MFAKRNFKNKKGDLIIIRILKQKQFDENKIVSFISETGKNIGKVKFSFAFNYAKQHSLDLALIADNGEQVIVKPIDYGKILYCQKKNLKKQRSNIVKNHQIKFKLNIAQNDYNIKLKKIKQFIINGDVVKATLQLTGRELSRTDFAYQFMRKIVEDLSLFCKTQDEINLNGRNISLKFKGL